MLLYNSQKCTHDTVAARLTHPRNPPRHHTPRRLGCTRRRSNTGNGCRRMLPELLKHTQSGIRTGGCISGERPDVDLQEAALRGTPAATHGSRVHQSRPRSLKCHHSASRLVYTDPSRSGTAPTHTLRTYTCPEYIKHREPAHREEPLHKCSQRR